MAILDSISIGWMNGWWFTALFGLVNVAFIIKNPKHFSKRIFRLPPFNSLFERVVSMISVIVFTRGMMIFTIFATIKTGTSLFYVGILIFFAGMLFYIGALSAYAKTEEASPVTTGVYRISRHPMQVFSIIMWVGVGLATHSWIIIMLCCTQPFLMHRFLISQERFCLEKYGEPYRDYFERTPRYLAIL